MQKVGIVGCGQMGAGIAEIAAKAGLDVVAREINDELLGKAQGRIEKSLRRAVEKGKLDEAGMESALGRSTSPPNSMRCQMQTSSSRRCRKT